MTEGAKLYLAPFASRERTAPVGERRARPGSWRRRRVGVLGATLVVLGLGGCAADPRGAEVELLRERLSPTYDDESGRLSRLAYDADGDGVSEAVAYMDGARVERVEVDENQDGIVDRREFFVPVGEGSAAAGRGGTVGRAGVALERIERSPGPGGEMTRVEHFDAGVLRSIEIDADADGRIDTWETYVEGKLSIAAFDTLGRGTPDRRFVYLPGGEVRVEVDLDGRGEFTPVDPDS